MIKEEKVRNVNSIYIVTSSQAQYPRIARRHGACLGGLPTRPSLLLD